MGRFCRPGRIPHPGVSPERSNMGTFTKFRSLQIYYNVHLHGSSCSGESSWEERILIQTCRVQWRPLEGPKRPLMVLNDPRIILKVRRVILASTPPVTRASLFNERPPPYRVPFLAVQCVLTMASLVNTAVRGRRGAARPFLTAPERYSAQRSAAPVQIGTPLFQPGRLCARPGA